jgi:hypothetical protein
VQVRRGKEVELGQPAAAKTKPSGGHTGRLRMRDNLLRERRGEGRGKKEPNQTMAKKA